jgi:hypothetical protein
MRAKNFSQIPKIPLIWLASIPTWFQHVFGLKDGGYRLCRWNNHEPTSNFSNTSQRSERSIAPRKFKNCRLINCPTEPARFGKTDGQTRRARFQARGSQKDIIQSKMKPGTFSMKNTPVF